VEALNEEIKNKILEYLKTTRIGASSSEISKNIKHNRVTVTKYLEIMKAHGILNYEDVAQAKLWRICNKKEKSSILIVDDEPHVVNLVKLSLTKDKFTIREANSGMEALELLQKHKPDLIILDLMMPGMNGYEVCEELKKDPKTSNIPVIILSAKSQLADKLEGMDCGAEDYITKPFDPMELEARVNMALRKIDSEDSKHPITGLPTENSVVEQIQQRILVDQNFVTYGVSIDGLNNFNNNFGSKKTSDLFEILKRILVGITEETNSFLGQSHNDTFIILTQEARFEKRLQEAFTEALPYIYSESEDARKVSLSINKVPSKEIKNKKVGILQVIPEITGDKK